MNSIEHPSAVPELTGREQASMVRPRPAGDIGVERRQRAPRSAATGALDVLWDDAARDYLAGAWAQLYAADSAATPFQSAPYYLGWLATAGAESVRPLVARLVHVGGTLAMALQCRTDSAGEVVEPLTTPWSDYVRPVGVGSEDPALCRALFGDLPVHTGSDRQVHVSELAEGSPAVRALNAVPDWTRAVCSRTAQVRLPGRWASLPTSGEHGRKLRRLAAAGAVAVIYSANRTELVAATERLIDLHADQWADRTDAVAPFTDPVVAACYRTLAASMNPEEMIVSELTLDGRTIAAYLGFARGPTYYAYRPAMSRAHYRISPGHLLLLSMLRDFTARYDVFDLTRGEYGYKQAYADQWCDNLEFRFGWEAKP
jgi:CelD/BcsL family acetyltransferase involved in cellulose biosynthesis